MRGITIGGCFVAATLGMAPLGFAQDKPQAGPQAPAAARYDGHKLIRVQVQNLQQLAAIEASGAVPWNCIIGLGRQDFSASPKQLAAIRAKGIAFEVLNDNIQALIDAERASMLAHAGDGVGGDQGGIAGGPSWFADYKTWPQVNAYIDTLVALRPDLASKVTVGTTIEGRTIYGIRITSPVGSNKPAILFSGCQHAREWVAVMTPTYIADALVRQYDTNPQIHDLLDRIEFFIVPIVNPDGYEYTYAPAGNRLWRKNRRDNLQGDFGVDLNRNWGVDWGGTGSTSSNPGSDVYYGTGPFSEPETASVRDFIVARPQLKAHIDFHSYGQLILQNWGYTNASAPDADLIAAFGGDMNQHLWPVNQKNYNNGWGGSLLYLASGVFPDWCYGIRGMISYTIELRDTGQFGFVLPADQIIPTASEALPAALTLADRISRGVEFLFPRGRPPVALAGSFTTFYIDVRPIAGTQVQPGSPTMYCRLGPGHPFVAIPLMPVMGTLYQTTLPGAACGTKIQYYIQAANTAGVPFTSPADAPASFFEAVAVNPMLSYNFETLAGWTTNPGTAFTGQWQRGTPANSVNWPYDPLTDADSSGQCWLTQNGTGNFTGVSNGQVFLFSPTFDLSSFNAGANKPQLSFSYFLHTTAADGTHQLKLDISAGGLLGPWLSLWSQAVSGGTQWRSISIDANAIKALINYGPNTMLRFTAINADNVSITEAGIDGVRVSSRCPSPCAADVNESGIVNIDDLLATINAWGTCPALPSACPADIAPAGGNGTVNIDDLLAVINAWGPCP